MKPECFLFLDRDGVINQFPGFGNYVVNRRLFRFIPKSIEAIKLLTEAGFRLVVVSNQGCVSRGLISLENLDQLTRYMRREIEKKGGKLQDVYYCVHQTSDACDCKKPQVRLFKQAIRGKKVDLKNTYFIGDSLEDMQAGKTLKCKTILVLSGRLKKKDLKALPVKPDFIKKDLWEAARWITAKKS